MAPCRIGGLEQTSGAGNLMQSHLVIWLHSIRVTLPAAPRILLCAPLGTQEKPGPFGGSGKFCPGRMELVFLLLLWSGHSLLIQLEQHFCGCAGHVHDPSACNALPRDRHEMPRHLTVPNPQIGLPCSKCTHCHTWHAPPSPSSL